MVEFLQNCKTLVPASTAASLTLKVIFITANKWFVDWPSAIIPDMQLSGVITDNSSVTRSRKWILPWCYMHGCGVWNSCAACCLFVMDASEWKISATWEDIGIHGRMGEYRETNKISSSFLLGKSEGVKKPTQTNYHGLDMKNLQRFLDTQVGNNLKKRKMR